MAINPIGSAVQAYQKATINPAVSAGIQGTAAFGVGVVGWNRIMDTLRSMLRRPVSMVMKMTPQEFDAEMEDIKNDEKLRWILPGALGTGILGLSLAASHRPNEEYGGLLSWNAKAKPFDDTAYRGYIMPGTQNLSKSAALQKLADISATFDGYVPYKEVADSTMFSGPWLTSLASNDPWMDNRTKYTLEAISNATQMREGSSNISAGALQDVTRDKMKSKFSLMGVTDVLAKTVLANTAAKLFVNAVGTMAGVSEDTQQDLISSATWYQAAKSLLT
jgi:hypothetical protein